MTKINIDEEQCIGCGSCVSACPDCFELGDDGKSHSKDGGCDSCDLEEVALDCPVQAITIEKDES